MPRSQTRALAKQAQAVHLYTRGCTFQEIANRVGFANRGTVHRVVNQALKARIIDDIDLHRQAKGDELRRLLAVCWDVINADSSTVEQKLRAARVALEINIQLIKLFDLEFCHECDLSWRNVVRS